MLYAQIDPGGLAGLYDSDSNPGGGWNIIRPLLEEQDYLFIELDKPELPGTHYDREKGEFYTPTFETPKPTEAELLQEQVIDLSHKLDRQSAILMDLGMTLMPPPEVPDTPPDLPPMPPEGAMPSAEDLKGMMDGAPPDLPTP